jgi:uncharacterized membrane protein (DUF2068 family)
MSRSAVLIGIVWFDVLRAAALFLLGADIFHHLNDDLREIVEHWIETFRLDPHNRRFNWLMAALSGWDRRRLEEVGIGTFFYAILLLLEGVGLWFGRRWAAYLSVVVVAVFIPLEIFELAKEVTGIRLTVLAVNALIVWYLTARILWRHPETPPSAAA